MLLSVFLFHSGPLFLLPAGVSPWSKLGSSVVNLDLIVSTISCTSLSSFNAGLFDSTGISTTSSSDSMFFTFCWLLWFLPWLGLLLLFASWGLPWLGLLLLFTSLGLPWFGLLLLFTSWGFPWLRLSFLAWLLLFCDLFCHLSLEPVSLCDPPLPLNLFRFGVGRSPSSWPLLDSGLGSWRRVWRLLLSWNAGLEYLLWW